MLLLKKNTVEGFEKGQSQYSSSDFDTPLLNHSSDHRKKEQMYSVPEFNGERDAKVKILVTLAFVR